MTEEMTRAGMEAEARRRYREAVERGKASNERWLCALYTAIILGGVAIALAYAHLKREERDTRAETERAHCELVAVTLGGGAR